MIYIVETKRLVLSWGEEGACYQYGGVDHVPCPWPEELKEVCNLMRKRMRFNNLFYNLYIKGGGMGAHRDSELDIVKNSDIGIISFGEWRVLEFV